MPLGWQVRPYDFRVETALSTPSPSPAFILSLTLKINLTITHSCNTYNNISTQLLVRSSNQQHVIFTAIMLGKPLMVVNSAG